MPPRDQPELPPIPAGGFSPGKFCLSLAVGPLVGLLWAWVAQETQSYAPFVLFPILVGILVGLTIVGTARFAQLGHHPTIVLSVLLAAVVAAAGQHYISYIVYVARYSSAKAGENADITLSFNTGVSATANGSSRQDMSALARKLAPSFGEYLVAQANRGRPVVGHYAAKGWAAWFTWAVDAILTLAAAVAVTIPMFRVPFCNRCRTWYRTVRNGRIDVLTAQRLAESCGIEETVRLRSPRYRLSCCHTGCGPTFCELSWEEPDGAVALVRLWLDAERRNEVTAILDELAEDDRISDDG